MAKARKGPSILPTTIPQVPHITTWNGVFVARPEEAPAPRKGRLPGPKGPHEGKTTWGTLLVPGAVTNTPAGSRVLYELENVVEVEFDGLPVHVVPGESLLLSYPYKES